jgi:hypothetical protein
VRPRWEDLAARVSGLGTHLLDPGQLEACRRAGDLDALVEPLRRAGVVTGELAPPVVAAVLEREVRRWAAHAVATLGRWLGARQAALPFLLLECDRRSVRAMLRGTAARAPAARRLAGLIPTPTLPERALETLADAPTASEVTGHLAAWHHPFAAPLRDELGVAEPDLFRLEVVLARVVAAEAVRAAGRSGDPDLRRHVEESIDLENLAGALCLAAGHADVDPGELFLEGGHALGRAAYLEVIASGSGEAALRRLVAALAGSGWESCLRRPAGHEELESCLRRRQLQAVTRRVRERPVGPLAVIHFGLRLEDQVVELQRLIWTAALGRVRPSVPCTAGVAG